jgi:hypothetical protein
VILAQGSRFGGHSLFIKDRRLRYVYNFLGLKPEQQLESEPLEPGADVLGVEFIKERLGEHRESHGTAKLYVELEREREVDHDHPGRRLRGGEHGQYTVGDHVVVRVQQRTLGAGERERRPWVRRRAPTRRSPGRGQTGPPPGG